MPWKRFLLGGLAGLFALLASSQVLAENQAVAGIDGTLQSDYGHVDGREAHYLAGSLTLSTGAQAGVQLNGAYGELGSDQLKGIGLQLFTRDPNRYLLGILGAHAELQDVDLNRVGLEGELYRGPITLASLLGYQLGDVDQTPFGTLELRCYPHDDLLLSLGGSLAGNDDGRLRLNAEYQLLTGLSGYVDFAVGENRYEHALFGIKVYFGTRKDLSRRHREEALSNPIAYNLLQGLGSIREQQRETGR